VGGCQLHSNAVVEIAVVNVCKCKSPISAWTQFETHMKVGQMHNCSQGLYYGTLVDFLYGVFVIAVT